MESKGGETSYLNNFVDNVLGNNKITGGAKKRNVKKKGGFEFSPFLVSLVNIGAALAVDPKLNSEKSEKSEKRSKSPVRAGGKSRRKTRGGLDMSALFNQGGDNNVDYTTGGHADLKEAFNALSQDNMTGGDKRKGRGKKNHGGNADLKEAFNALSQDNMTGGRGRRKKNHGGSADLKEAFNALSQDNMVGGRGRRKKNNGGSADLKEAFNALSQDNMAGGGWLDFLTGRKNDELPVEPPITGGKRKTSRKASGGTWNWNAFRSPYGGGGEGQMSIDAQLAQNEVMNNIEEPFSLFGGTKRGGTRRNKSKQGGYLLQTKRGPIDIQCTAKEVEDKPNDVQYNMDQPIQQQMGPPMGQPMGQQMGQQMGQPMGTTGGRRKYKKGGGMELIPDMQSPKLGGRNRRQRGGNFNEAQDLMLLPPPQ